MKPIAPMFIAIAVAGCGPAATQTSTLDNQEPATAGAAAATPCPTGEELSNVARTAWGKTGGTVTTDCVAASVGGETLWLIDGYFEPEPNDDFMLGMWTALVTPAGETRWVEGGDDFPYGAIERSYSSEYQAVDLDGDGNDEIVFVSGYSHGGYDESQLGVMRVTANAIEMVSGDGLPLSSDNSAAGLEPAETATCDAQREITDAGGGRKLIAISYAGDCTRTGKVVWAYDGKTLVETAP